MCPELEILSAYYDNEIEEPHKSEIEKHVDSCPHCSEVLREFADISIAVSSEPEPDFLASSSCVWDKIQNSLEKNEEEKGFWKKKILFSIPAAAGIAALFIAVFSMSILGFYIGKNSAGSVSPAVVSGTNMADSRSYSMAVEDIFQDNDVDFIIPASENFVYAGEPVLIKEVDFMAEKKRY